MLVDVDVWAGDIHAGTLPQICVLTGEATRGVHTVRYSMFPRWVWALLLVGVVPFFIGVVVTRRSVTGTLPMNVRALRRFVVQRVATLIIVVAVPALCFVVAAGVWAASDQAGGALVVAGLLVLVVGAVVCSIWGGVIGVAGAVEDREGWGRWVRLRGVNPTFAAAVRRMYAGRMPQWQIGTVPSSFAGVPLPKGYGPPPPPPGWVSPVWSPAGPVAAAPMPPSPPAR